MTDRSWLRWAPGLDALRHYRAGWLLNDSLSGLVLATMLVPVGIAYAVASGLPGISGLYATIVPLLAYAVFGPSRILVLGPDSSLAPLILGVVLPLSAGDPARAVALAAAMAIVSGLVCIAAGAARLGFVTELLSKPIRIGYMNGIALTVLVGQIPKLLGLSISAGGPFESLAQVVKSVFDGQVRGTAATVGVGSLLVILSLKPLRQIPGILIAVVVATLAVSILGLGDGGQVDVLGPLPQGLPSLSWPMVAWGDASSVLVGGLAIALVSFADTSVLSRVYAARTGAPVDPNREMMGLGAANLAAGLFNGFPISASSSRTPVAEAAGAKTQVAGIVGALAVALLLVAAPNLLADMPAPALAAVVIASALGLFEARELLRIRRMQAWEFWLSIACSAGVVIVGVIPGIGIAIAISIIEFLWDGWRPHWAVLGRAPGVEGYHDVTRYPDAEQMPGLLLIRWDAPLFFANAEFFRECVLRAVGTAAHPVRCVIVAAEPVTSIDVTAGDTLSELHRALVTRGIDLHFAELKDPVRDKLRQFDMLSVIGTGSFFPTIESAVHAFVQRGSEG